MIIIIEATWAKLPNFLSWAPVPGRTDAYYTRIEGVRTGFEVHTSLRQQGFYTHLSCL